MHAKGLALFNSLYNCTDYCNEELTLIEAGFRKNDKINITFYIRKVAHALKNKFKPTRILIFSKDKCKQLPEDDKISIILNEKEIKIQFCKMVYSGCIECQAWLGSIKESNEVEVHINNYKIKKNITYGKFTKNPIQIIDEIELNNSH